MATPVGTKTVWHGWDSVAILNILAIPAAVGMDTLGPFHVAVRGDRVITEKQADLEAAGLHLDPEVADLSYHLPGWVDHNRRQEGIRYCRLTPQHHAVSAHVIRIWLPGLSTIAKG